MASVQIKLFASLRESVGTEHIEVEFENSQISVAELLSKFAEMSDSFKAYYEHLPVLTAVNQLMVDSNYLVEANDEVALFPPVTGG